MMYQFKCGKYIGMILLILAIGVMPVYAEAKEDITITQVADEDQAVKLDSYGEPVDYNSCVVRGEGQFGTSIQMVEMALIVVLAALVVGFVVSIANTIKGEN